MTDTRKAQLEIGVNAGPAEDGFKRVERAAQGMGQQVSKEAANTAQAMKGMGEEAKKQGDNFKGMGEQAKASAKEQETATRSMIASVQRATAAYEAGEKGTAKYFEFLAKQRGLDMAAIQPHLDAMRAMEAANAKVGVSAKQTAAAMRGVPAQFTDIVTSLQGGQAPLTVLLQQGGQLKDMFGGAGNAARALGGFVVGLVNPFTVAAAAAGAVGLAYYKGSQEADAFRQSLVMTGNAAGASVAQLAGMAESIGSGYGKTTGAAAAALAQLAATGEVGRASLLGFATTAVDAERVLGIAVKDIAKNFADLAKDPAAASLKLNESMHYLTASTYAQIKAAQDLGQTTKAASMAQDAYNQALKGRTAEVLASAGTIEKAWSGIKNAASGAWDAMLGIGREKNIDGALADARERLKKTNDRMKSYGEDSMFTPILKSDAAKQQAEIERLLEIERLQKRAGDSAAERIAREEAGIKAQQDGLKYLSDEQKMRNDIAQQTATMVKAGKTQAEIEERIQQIRASYAKKGGGALGAGESEAANLRAQVKEAQLYLDALQQQGAEIDKLTTGEKAVLKIREELKGNLTAAVRLQKEKALSEAEALANIQKRTEAEREDLKILKESSVVNAKAFEEAAKRTQSIAQEIDQQKQQNAAIGLTKEAMADLTARRLEDAAATAEQNAQTQELINPAIAAELRKQADQYRELAKLKREGASAEATTEAQKKMLEAWQRTTSKIEDSLTDALMRGFENGKTFAQNLRDTLINMFKTMVLRPVIQGVVSLGMGAVGLGAPGMATAQGVNGINAASNAYSAYQAGNTAFSLGAQWAAGTMSAANVGATIYGNATAAAYGDGLSAMLAANGAYGTAAGTAASAGTAGAAAGGSSAMSSAATAVPYVAAALAIANAMGLFRSTAQVGGGLTGTLGAGDIQQYDLMRKSGTLFSGPDYSLANSRVYDVRRTAQKDALGTYVEYAASAKTLSQGLQDAYSLMRTASVGMADQLGLAGQGLSTFTTQLGTDVLHPDTGGLGIVLDGLSAEQANAKVAAAIATAGEQLARQVLGTMKTVTESMSGWSSDGTGESGAGNSGWFTTVTEKQIYVASEFAKTGETAAQTLQRLSGSLGSVNGVLGLLNQSLLSTSLAGGDAASKLVDVFGGMDNFTQSTSAYYQAFYSESERNAKVTEQLTQKITGLGLSMPGSIAGFRKLVDAQDLTSEAGRQTYAALVALSPAFAQVTAQSANAAEAIQAIGRSAADIAQEAQGLQDQLDQLLGNTAALRKRERSALDESNRALYDQINALQDSRTAAEQAAQAEQARQSAAEQAAQAQAAVAQERVSLQIQLDQLLGNSAALRDRERAAISASNLALYDQIAALQEKQAAETAAAAAAQESARAAEQLRTAWTGIFDGIEDEINRIRGVLDTGGAYSLASAQAKFAVTTAQARAGDQAAAQSLPQLSKALLDAAAVSATSALELKRIQGQTAGVLAQTLAQASIYASGMAGSAQQVSSDFVAGGGKPAASASVFVTAAAASAAAKPVSYAPIYSAGFAPQLQPLSMPTASPQADPNAALLQELQALRAQVARLEASGAATATNTLKTKDVLVQVTRDGVAVRTVPA